jgi:hypothetical protein
VSVHDLIIQILKVICYHIPCSSFEAVFLSLSKNAYLFIINFSGSTGIAANDFNEGRTVFQALLEYNPPPFFPVSPPLL